MSGYPRRWEADGLLRDGRPIHLRPIQPEDADTLRAFHESLSEETVYFRFFAPYPKLSDRDVRRFTELDYVNRVAIVAFLAGELIGIGRYDRVGPHDAEVAFVISDDHQGRGLGSILLEHLAAAARENDIWRFVADVLPANKRMAATFAEAGFTVTSSMEDGVVHVEFDIEPTSESRRVMEAREHRSEAMSVRRLLTPSSVAVVGASRSPGTVGHELLANIVAGGFTGSLHAVHPHAVSILDVPCVPRLLDIEGDVDVAIIAVNSSTVASVVDDAAAKGVLGLVIVSSGFADSDEEGLQRQRELVRRARRAGMRILGPNALGMINTDPAVSLNASLAPRMPERGRVGFFCQSGALGRSILARVAQRQLGLSTFVSAGNRADVSGNDVLQYWEEDPATSIVLLYLESIGNPRKFARLTRRLSLTKPIVAVRTSGSTRINPAGHLVRKSELSKSAIDALLRESGIVQTGTLEELLRVASLLSYQPIPRGKRVRVVSNSDALAVLAVNAAERAELTLGDPIIVSRSISVPDFTETLHSLVNDDEVDSVLVMYVPPVESDIDEEIREAMLSVSMTSTKPISAVLIASDEERHLIAQRGPNGIPVHGSIPLFADVENAMSAIASVANYAQWLREPRGEWLEYDDLDIDAAEEIVLAALADTEGDGGEVALDRDTCSALLTAAGISLWPSIPVSTEDEAVVAGYQLGWPVVVKTTDPRYLGRPELGGVRLSVQNERDLRTAFLSMRDTLDAEAASRLVVQRMAEPGVSCALAAVEDPLLGPVVSFSIGGAVSELLDDTAYRLAPMTDVDAATMVRELRTAPLLFGYRGAKEVQVAALEELLGRLGVLIDAIAQIDRIELTPVIASSVGAAVLEARVVLRKTIADPQVRRLATL